MNFSQHTSAPGHLRAVLAALFIALAAPPSQSQTLNLGTSDAAPTLAGSPVVDDLIIRLERDRTAAETSQRGATDDVARVAHEAAALWRSAAIRLARLARDDRHPAAGAAFAAAATMERAGARADAIANDLARERDPALRAARCAGLRAFITRAGRAADAPIESVSDLDTLLRDLAADLADAAGLRAEPITGGWWPAPGADVADPAALDDAVATARRTGLLAADSLAALDNFTPRLLEARGRVGLSAPADEAMRELIGALRAVPELDLAAAPPPGGTGRPIIDRDVAEAVAARLSEALERFGDRATRDDARAIMSPIAAGGELLAAVRSLSRPGLDVSGVRRAATLGIGHIIDPVIGPKAEETIRAALRVLGLAAERRTLPARAEIPAAIQRAWSRLESDYANAERENFAALESIVRDPTTLKRPEGASMISRQSEAIGAMRDLLSAQQFITRVLGNPGAPRALADERALIQKAFTERVRVVELDATRVQGLVVIRALGADARRLEVLPGEVLLRSGDADMTAVLGARAGEIAPAIDAARAVWIIVWAGDDAERTAAAHGRLEQFERILGAASLYRALRRAGVIERARAWAALEFPVETAERLIDGMRAILAESITLLLDGKDQLAADALNHAEHRLSVLHMLAAAAERATEGSPIDPLIELATPPTDRAWLAPERGQLAELSRWFFELHAAHEARGDALAAAIEKHLADVASRIYRSTE